MLDLANTCSEVYLFLGNADMRLGIDRLVELVESYNPISGKGYFVFACRKRTRIRILYWDQDGYAVWLKRLEAGKYRISSNDIVETLNVEDLKSILSGVDLERIKFQRSIKINEISTKL